MLKKYWNVELPPSKQREGKGQWQVTGNLRVVSALAAEEGWNELAHSLFLSGRATTLV